MKTFDNTELQNLLARYVVPPAETATALPQPVTVTVVASPRGAGSGDGDNHVY